MFVVLSKTWALFFGFAIICLAHGLQGSLIGVRSVLEGFTYISTGLIVAGYYVGFLLGSIIIPIFLKRVGQYSVCPYIAGFGISDRSNVINVNKIAHGAVIGSAIIKELEKASDPAECVKNYIERLT